MHCASITITVIFANFLAISFACRDGRLIRNALVGSIDKYEILKAHNEYRNEVAQGRIPRQPGAENMLEMQWDDELAHIAQNWANRCVYLHNEDRTINRFNFGENLAIELNSEMTELRDYGNEFQPRVRSWFEEYKLYTFGQEFSKDTGHYTQIIWAETYLIGCGFTYFQRPDGLFVRFYVCNYGPGGNIRGEQPYITGNPVCSKYGLKSSKVYRGLCQATLVVSDDATDNTLSNDIQIPVSKDPFISFPQSTTEVYASMVTLQPERLGPPFNTLNQSTVTPSQHQTTILPNLSAKGSPSITYTEISTQQLPTTTITIPFSTTSQTTRQTTTSNAELSNRFESSTSYNNLRHPTTTIRNYQNQPVTPFSSYQFNPLTAQPQIHSMISPHEYEALIFNHHRLLLNEVFRRQQERTAEVQSYLINIGPNSPYFTYKWSELFN